MNEMNEMNVRSGYNWSGRTVRTIKKNQVVLEDTFTWSIQGVAIFESDYSGDIVETFGFCESYESTGGQRPREPVPFEDPVKNARHRNRWRVFFSRFQTSKHPPSSPSDRCSWQPRPVHIAWFTSLHARSMVATAAGAVSGAGRAFTAFARCRSRCESQYWHPSTN